jgi:hypothetical protein
MSGRSLRNVISLSPENRVDNSIFTKYKKNIARYIDTVINQQKIPEIIFTLIAEYLLPDTRVALASYDDSYDNHDRYFPFQLRIMDTKNLEMTEIKIDVPEMVYVKDIAHSHFHSTFFCHIESPKLFNFEMNIMPFGIVSSPAMSMSTINLFVIFENEPKLVKLSTFFFPQKNEPVRPSCLQPQGFISANKVLFLYCDYTGELQIISCSSLNPKLLHSIDFGWAYDFKLKLNEGTLFFPRRPLHATQPTSYDTQLTYIYDVLNILTANDHDQKNPAAPKLIGVVPMTNSIKIFQDGRVFFRNDLYYYYNAYNKDEKIDCFYLLELSDTSVYLRKRDVDYLTNKSGVTKRIISPSRSDIKCVLPGNRILLPDGIADFAAAKIYPLPKSIPSNFVIIKAISFHSHSSDRRSFVEQFS